MREVCYACGPLCGCLTLLMLCLCCGCASPNQMRQVSVDSHPGYRWGFANVDSPGIEVVSVEGTGHLSDVDLCSSGWLEDESAVTMNAKVSPAHVPGEVAIQWFDAEGFQDRQVVNLSGIISDLNHFEGTIWLLYAGSQWHAVPWTEDDVHRTHELVPTQVLAQSKPVPADGKFALPVRLSLYTAEDVQREPGLISLIVKVNNLSDQPYQVRNRPIYQVVYDHRANGDSDNSTTCAHKPAISRHGTTTTQSPRIVDVVIELKSRIVLNHDEQPVDYYNGAEDAHSEVGPLGRYSIGTTFGSPHRDETIELRAVAHDQDGNICGMTRWRKIAVKDEQKWGWGQ